MTELLEIMDKIINSNKVTDGENSFYTIDERKLKALRELLKREELEAKNKDNLLNTIIKLVLSSDKEEIIYRQEKGQLQGSLELVEKIEKDLDHQLPMGDKIRTAISKIEEMQKDENKYKDYLEGFDEEFEINCKQRIKETPLLLSLFQEFVQQIYRPSKLYELARKTKTIISDELINTLDNEQKELLEQWQYCEDRMLDDMIEQAFIFRLCNVCATKR